MRIAITVFGNIGAVDGETVRPLRIAKLLGESHEVTIIPKSSRKPKGKAAALNMWALRVPLRAVQAVWWGLKLSYVILTNKLDIVYCSSDYYGFAALYMWSKVRQFSVIYEAHCIMSEDLKEIHYPTFLVNLFKVLERRIFKHAHYVIALSPNTFEYCHAYSNRVELVPVFIDEDLFKPPSKRPTTKDSKTIGLIGPFIEPRKREDLRLLYSNIERFDKRLRFLVIGHCEGRIQHERIEYTGYLDSPQDYVDQLTRLDAVLVPETMASTGPLNKIIEPMSCSIPVFTTPKGMVALYWVEPGKDILVFEQNELMDKISELIFDDELMAEIGTNARKVIERFYSKKVNAQKLLGILELIAETQK